MADPAKDQKPEPNKHEKKDNPHQGDGYVPGPIPPPADPNKHEK
jgi:hypothetical protein